MLHKMQYIIWFAACIACWLQPLGVLGQLTEDLSINLVELGQFAAHPNIQTIEQGQDGFDELNNAVDSSNVRLDKQEDG